MKRPATNIIAACSDRKLFAPWFKRPESWQAWFAFLRTLFGLELSDADRALFSECTGREEPRAGGHREAWLVVGRRGGKSLVLALIAVYLAALVDWKRYLTPGERGTIMLVAADRRQARTIFRYIKALIAEVPLLAPLIERETADALDLSNGITIEILTASFRTVRGYTLVAALLDEVAFWRSEESANPDTEIIGAIRPAMATIPGAMLLCASSPYARRGALWDAYRRHYGETDSSVLVWKAPTQTMNPTVPQSVIDEATEADPTSAAAEYGAEFRSDVEGYVSREVIDAAVVPGRHELPLIPGSEYVAFVDPSGGSSDAMTLAIAHREVETGKVILDVLREVRPPFSPESVVTEFAELLRRYNIGSVRRDRYGGLWPREQFQTHGIEYRVADKPKSDLYRDLLPALNSGQVELLDHPRLVAQLCGLERRTARSGKDTIDHPIGSHDDAANAVAGAIVTILGRPSYDAPSVAPIIIDQNGHEVTAPSTNQAGRPPSHWLKLGQKHEAWMPFVGRGRWGI